MFLLAQQSGVAGAEPHGFQSLLGQWSSFYESWGYAIENSVVVLLVLLSMWLVRSARRIAFWRDATRRVFQNRRAVVSAVVLFFYLLVGVLDSVAWRDSVVGSDGQPLLTNQSVPVLEQHGRSLLDRIDRAMFDFSGSGERTYSSPLADRAFTKSTVETAGGRVDRVRPALQHPRLHLLGTDQVGTDVMYKALKGVRTALVIGGMTTLIAIPFAIFFGMQAGYYGRRVDDAITYVYSTLASIPSILLIIAFVLTFGRGLFQLCIVMGITTWTGFCRVIRGEVLKLREMDYVVAARAVGAGGWIIQWRHILPNVMHLVVIRTVLMFSGLVLAEAVLSYLNVGVGAGTYSWGTMINQGRFELSREPVIWWNLLAAFVLMFGLVLPANVFGDAVRDALDPRLKGVGDVVTD